MNNSGVLTYIKVLLLIFLVSVIVGFRFSMEQDYIVDTAATGAVAPSQRFGAVIEDMPYSMDSSKRTYKYVVTYDDLPITYANFVDALISNHDDFRNFMTSLLKERSEV